MSLEVPPKLGLRGSMKTPLGTRAAFRGAHPIPRAASREGRAPPMRVWAFSPAPGPSRSRRSAARGVPSAVNSEGGSGAAASPVRGARAGGMEGRVRERGSSPNAWSDAEGPGGTRGDPPRRRRGRPGGGAAGARSPGAGAGGASAAAAAGRGGEGGEGSRGRTMGACLGVCSLLSCVSTARPGYRGGGKPGGHR